MVLQLGLVRRNDLGVLVAELCPHIHVSVLCRHVLHVRIVHFTEQLLLLVQRCVAVHIIVVQLVFSHRLLPVLLPRSVVVGCLLHNVLVLRISVFHVVLQLGLVRCDDLGVLVVELRPQFHVGVLRCHRRR